MQEFPSEMAKVAFWIIINTRKSPPETISTFDYYINMEMGELSNGSILILQPNHDKTATSTNTINIETIIKTTPSSNMPHFSSYNLLSKRKMRP